MIKVLEKLHKCRRSRITGMKSYKIKYEENQLFDTFVVKVYDEDNFFLHIEKDRLKKITGFRNIPRLICNFPCNDHKQYCFVYEYIVHGNIGKFLLTTQDIHVIKSIILQMTCVIIQLASIYRMYYGCINTGNFLIDIVHERTVEYSIEGETFMIESHGIMPKVIDFGRSYFCKEGPISNYRVWFDIILMLSVIQPYTQNEELKQKLFDISKNIDLDLPSLKDYYIYIRDKL